MVTIGMNYDVIEGKAEEFEKVFYKVLGIMETMPGHGESRLYRDVSKPLSYLIVSQWSNEAAFDAFTQSEQFKNVVDWGKEKILSSRPKHEVYGREPAPKAGGCPVPH
ncbi:MAG: antibiotic biosynthesis monooxygenase family protein [Phycisphaerae bacterium]